MQAAKSGMTNVCRLYLDHRAEVDAFTKVKVMFLGNDKERKA